MRRYIIPALIFAALIALLFGRIPFGPTDLADRLGVAAALYLVGLIWWVVAAITAGGEFRRRLLILWIPAAPPIIGVLAAGFALPTNDTAGLALAMFLRPALGASVVCAIATVACFLRRGRARSQHGAG